MKQATPSSCRLWYSRVLDGDLVRLLEGSTIQWRPVGTEGVEGRLERVIVRLSDRSHGSLVVSWSRRFKTERHESTKDTAT